MNIAQIRAPWEESLEGVIMADDTITSDAHAQHQPREPGTEHELLDGFIEDPDGIA
jgi:hypothetical protein